MKLRSVQVLRGIAACAVVWMHARYFAEPSTVGIARIGGFGVDLFFIISGFIMASIAKPSAGRFLFDRFWRVVPMWLIAVTPWLLWKQPGWQMTLSSLTLWPVYERFTPPALGVGWTLSFELLFYASIALAMRTSALLPLSLFAVSIVAGLFTGLPLFDFIGNPMIFEFLLGVAIARLPLEERIAPLAIFLGAVILSVAPLRMFLMEFATDSTLSIWRAAFWGIPAALIVYGTLALERHFTRWADPLVTLGNASYSIYLIHLGAIVLLDLSWQLEFAASVLAGLVVWRVVERPILRLKPKLDVQNDHALVVAVGPEAVGPRRGDRPA